MGSNGLSHVLGLGGAYSHAWTVRLGRAVSIQSGEGTRFKVEVSLTWCLKPGHISDNGEVLR
jgi:hypothetical protein